MLGCICASLLDQQLLSKIDATAYAVADEVGKQISFVIGAESI